MTIDPGNIPKVYRLYLEISQYPILGKQIRQRMRDELHSRGVVTKQVFENEVLAKAVQSQSIEGLTDPLIQETEAIWKERLNHIRDHLTDFYFAYNLPHDLFRQLVREVVSKRAPNRQFFLSFNPEIAPWDVLFTQGEQFESLIGDDRAQVEHHLQEIIVVLIKAMISDQLSFVRVARGYFTIRDLIEIRDHRIGRGKIGGKAAGMQLAYRILQRRGAERGLNPGDISIPESWYLASDVFYDFHSINDLHRFMNQKYKKPDIMLRDYPRALDAYMNSHLPDYVVEELSDLMKRIGKAPVIVRSSSLLEDNFDTSFAGKYDSFFLPNQASHEENLTALITAITKVYASVIRPDALIYREKMGLTDYDERMAILIQKVKGHQHGNYFFPDIAGVGFSHNPYRWNDRIDGGAGLLRLVTGLGTRAVDRVGNDYPRMVALSHPTLRPESGARMVRHYSQHTIDVINMEANMFESLPIGDVIDLTFAPMTAVMSVEREGYVQPLNHRPLRLDPRDLVVTFDTLLEQQGFVEVMRESLDLLEDAYGRPVDVEFAGSLAPDQGRYDVKLYLLQCRALSQRSEEGDYLVPSEISPDRVLFTAHKQVPYGFVGGISHIVFVDPHVYGTIPDVARRVELGRIIGRLNICLEGRVFILMGPGRWGSSNINLGVKVSYSDIYNARMLIEIAYSENGQTPEVSYGTHFFQDLVEANIYPLPLYPDTDEETFNERFFAESSNVLADLLPNDASYAEYIKVIDVAATTGGLTLSVVMNGRDEQAVAYLTDNVDDRPTLREY